MAQAKSNRVAGNIFKGSVGNLIEWYDWYVYSAFAVYFQQSSFLKEINRSVTEHSSYFSQLDF